MSSFQNFWRAPLSCYVYRSPPPLPDHNMPMHAHVIYCNYWRNFLKLVSLILDFIMLLQMLFKYVWLNLKKIKLMKSCRLITNREKNPMLTSTFILNTLSNYEHFWEAVSWDVRHVPRQKGKVYTSSRVKTSWVRGLRCSLKYINYGIFRKVYSFRIWDWPKGHCSIWFWDVWIHLFFFSEFLFNDNSWFFFSILKTATHM